jgi:site-specific DNA-methyltransferase (adenine-specific)
MNIQTPVRSSAGCSRGPARTVCIGDQTVMTGDCLVRMETLEAESVDVVVTSPPYNLGIAYRTYDDGLPREAYLEWMAEVAAGMKRVLKPDGSLFLNVGATNSDPWVLFDVAKTMRELFTLQNHIAWVKSISIGEDTVGHFKPISSYRYLNQNHEAIFHFTKSGTVPIDRLAVGVPYKDKTNIARRGHARDKRCAGNTWFIPYKTVQSREDKFNHPAAFPAGLAERCLLLHGIDRGVVLDPFLGSGSTLIAAQNLDWSGIGIEIDSVYAQTSIDRLRHARSRLAA